MQARALRLLEARAEALSRALRNAALALADGYGWHLLPLHPRKKTPLGTLVPNGFHDATSDLGVLLGWWTRHRQANIGVSCGASGLLVVDIDPRAGGDDSLHELERKLGTLPETVSAETGGGGAHYYFRCPEAETVGVLADGVDLKRHGYVLAEPSIHPSGRLYAWEIAPGEMPVATLPARWLEAMTQSVQLGTRGDLRVSTDHGDPLRDVAAERYVKALTGREASADGWLCCPFHAAGAETAPSFNCEGSLWACFGCPAPPGKRVQGGNLYDLAALAWGYAMPLRGTDFLEVQGRLARLFLLL